MHLAIDRQRQADTAILWKPLYFP